MWRARYLSSPTCHRSAIASGSSWRTIRATPRQPTYAGTCPRGKSSATGRKPRSQPRWAVVSGRSGAALGIYANQPRWKSDSGYDRAKHRMCLFNPSGLASGLSGLMSGLMSGLIQNHVQNHRRTTREAAAARASAASAAGAHGRPRLGRSATSAATNPARDRAPRPRPRGRTTTGGSATARSVIPSTEGTMTAASTATGPVRRGTRGERHRWAS